jgi:hypothetical protein
MGLSYVWRVIYAVLEDFSLLGDHSRLMGRCLLLTCRGIVMHWSLPLAWSVLTTAYPKINSCLVVSISCTRWTLRFFPHGEHLNIFNPKSHTCNAERGASISWWIYSYKLILEIVFSYKAYAWWKGLAPLAEHKIRWKLFSSTYADSGQYLRK